MMESNLENDAPPAAGADKLAWALWGARMGFPVFPCKVDSKEPAVSDWPAWATRDEAKIRATWALKPDANIGLYLAKGGFSALDLDMKRGDDGRGSLADLEILNAANFPDTLAFSTPSGGAHLIVRGVLKTRAKMRPGLDTRGEGGYIVGPGSAIGEKRYAVQHLRPIADCPEWFAAAAGRPNDRERGDKVSLFDPDLPENVARFESWLRERPGKPEGERNDYAAKVIGPRANDLGVTPETAAALADEIWNSKCDPPMDAAELELAIRSGHASADGPFGFLPFLYKDAGALMREYVPAWVSQPPADLDALKELARGLLAREIAFDDCKPRLAGRYVVKGLLDADSLALAYGESGAGKTFLVLDLLASVAAAIVCPDKFGTWRGRRVRGGGVVYGAAEAGASVANRVAGWRKHAEAEHKVSLDAAPFAVAPSPVDLTDPDSVAAFAAYCRLKKAEWGSLAAVAIDTLASALPGDENGEGMALAVAHLIAIRGDTGAAVLAVHHSGKDPTKGARGWSGLTAAMDTVVQVQKRKPASPGEASRVAVVEKQRDGVTGEEIAFTLRMVALGSDDDGETVQTCVAYADNRPPAKLAGKSKAATAPKLKGQAATALKALRRAIEEHGERVAVDDMLPAGTRGVETRYWRQVFALMLPGGREMADDTLQKAFRRAADKLAEAGLTQTWRDLTCIVAKGKAP